MGSGSSAAHHLTEEEAEAGSSWLGNSLGQFFTWDTRKKSWKWDCSMIFSKNNSKTHKLMQHEEVTTVGFTLRTLGFFHSQRFFFTSKIGFDVGLPLENPSTFGF